MKGIFNKNSHIPFITSIAKGFKEAGFLNKYLELGIQRGNCFNMVAPMAKEAYAVDILDSYELIKHNRNTIWFQGKSEDFLKQYSNIKFDLVFIDADHSHEASLLDFQMVLPLVSQNGLILLHDTYPPSVEYTSLSYCGEAYKTADYIRKNYQQVECMTFPFYYGITVVRNLDHQLLWVE
jgi:hypothetical protein